MSCLLRLSIALFVFLSTASRITAQDLAPLPYKNPDWIKPYEPFRIAGNLYYVGTYDLASYLVTTPEGHILINTGLAETVPLLQKNVESLGFKFSDIKILLVTHPHYDHAAGFADIKKMTGAKMMVNAVDAKLLEDGGKSDFIFGGPKGLFPGVKADRLLKDGDIIKLGDAKLTAYHHPGHTPGATSFLVETKDETRPWKVLIVNMPTILDETRIMGMPKYPKVGEDYKYTLESLPKLKFDLWVSAHASQFDLHEKRKPGDPYKPELFGDRKAYDAAVADLQKKYDDRVKAEKK
jgi:metallo-beta-lactamase class B